MKRIVSFLLVFATVFSLYAGINISANAKEKYDYPAYFEVTTPKNGEEYAVCRTQPSADSQGAKINLGTLIQVTEKSVNSSGNIWYKIKTESDYKWIYSEYVSYRGSISNYSGYMETQNGGKYWTKPWSSETSKYTSSATFGNGKVLKISYSINRNGTIWYKVYNEGKYIFSDNVKKHTCTSTTISRSNYKSVSSTQHSYDYTYRVCSNTTCPNYSVTKSSTITQNHNLQNGICSNCQYWEVKSTSSVNNVKYVVTADNVKVHSGPYGACKTVNILSKGTVIIVTQAIKNCEGHIWYKYSGGYVFGDYLKKLSSGITVFKCSSRTVASQKVEWNKVAGAAGYQVQISNAAGNKWDKAYKVTATSYVFKNLAPGNNYKFRVRCFKKDEKGKEIFYAWSTTLNSPTLPKGTSITKLTGGKKCFTAQWKKAPYTGYQIQYSTNAKFTGAKKATAKDAKKLKATIGKLNAKKVYYVRIRTYKTISKVHYFSTWSKIYKVKTK